MKMEATQSSETWAYKTQTPGNYPEESPLHPQHGKSLKATKISLDSEEEKELGMQMGC
jgi:hypothetical protein